MRARWLLILLLFSTKSRWVGRASLVWWPSWLLFARDVKVSNSHNFGLGLRLFSINEVNNEVISLLIILVEIIFDLLIGLMVWIISVVGLSIHILNHILVLFQERVRSLTSDNLLGLFLWSMRLLLVKLIHVYTSTKRLQSFFTRHVFILDLYAVKHLGLCQVLLRMQSTRIETCAVPSKLLYVSRIFL